MTGSADVGPQSVPRLHVVTDDAVIAHQHFRRTAKVLLQKGGGRIALHLRGHRTTGRTLMDHAEYCAVIARETGTRLLLNDRLDVALACGADGVQLGQRSLSPSDARSILGPSMLIGVSIHSVAEAVEAAGDGADFLLAGTLYPSASHPHRPASGAAWLKEISGPGLPVIGIGGIDPARVTEVLRAGAHGVAVIRGIWAAAAPEAALARYLEKLLA